MAKVFMDAKDKNVATIVLYSDDFSTFYYDEEMEKEVDFEKDGVELFLKGVVVKEVSEDNVNYYAAVSCSEDGTITFSNPVK